MKKLTLLTISILLLTIVTACNNENKTQETSTAQQVKSGKVEMYYFHNERRCVTCQTVEDVSKEAVKEFYGDKVTFAAYNLETAEGEQKATELGVSGQTLLIVGGKTKINITNEGFLNARSNPDKLKQIIKEKIDAIIQ